MLGKQKCRILKEIRQRIADENDIPYVTRACSFQGECSGTCPRCESELRYLEQQLALRQSLGKRVAATALCATMALAASGCGPERGGGEVTRLEGEIAPYENELTGMIAPCETEFPEGNELLGEPTPDPGSEEYELMGDMEWIQDEDAAGETDHG